ncbi:MAG: FAD binding domain-containing protein, partial [Janthinobacterium lividum]
MKRFSYARPTAIAAAVREGAIEGVRYLAGGTNLVDLMKEYVERPDRVIDINRLPLTAIEDLPGGGLRLGALATNADTAWDPRVEARYPL